MSTFEFLPDQLTPASKYEFVNFINGTPKNANDFHDMENIIRYRLNKMIRDLFGNCRVEGTPGEGFSSYAYNNKKYMRASGQWYIEGYRILIDPSIPLTAMAVDSDTVFQEVTTGSSYDLYLSLIFTEVKYNDAGAEFALVDPVTSSRIETSSRWTLTPTLKAVLHDAAAPTGIAYLIATAIWDTTDWTYIDAGGFVGIDKKYNEAMDIINKAVHTEADNKTVNVKRMVTNTVVDNPYLVIEEETENKLRASFIDHDGVTFASLEAVKQNGEWTPILWMKSSATQSSTSFISPDGLTVFDNRSNSSTYSDKIIKMGNRNTGFICDSDQMSFNIGGKPGIDVKEAAVNLVTSSFAMVLQSGTPANLNDGSFGVGAVLNSDILNTGTALKTATYLSDPISNLSELPLNNILSLNHKIILDSPLHPAVVQVVVSASEDNINWTEVHTQKWILQSGALINSIPYEVDLTPTSGNWINSDTNIYVKAVYSINPLDQSSVDVSGKVGFNTTAVKAITCKKFTDSYAYTEVPHLLINGHIVWIDAAGVMRVKKNSGSLGTDIKAMRENTSGNTVTENGGAGVKTGEDAGITDITFETPTTETAPGWNLETRTLTIPKIDSAMTNQDLYGLISVAQLKAALIDQVGKSISTNFAYPGNTVYVAKTWSPEIADVLHFTTITGALNYVSENFTDGLVIVYPGVYIEDINLTGASGYTGTRKLAIVAIESNSTIIQGRIYDNGKSVEAFVGAHIVQAAGSPAVQITNINSKVIFNDITSTQSTTVVEVQKGKVEIKGTITHTTSTPASPSIAIGSTASGVDDVTVTLLGNNTFTNKKGVFAIDAGRIDVRGKTKCIGTGSVAGDYVIKVSGNQRAIVDFYNDIHSAGIQLIKTNYTAGIPSNVRVHKNIYVEEGVTDRTYIDIGASTALYIDGDILLYDSTTATCIFDNYGMLYIKSSRMEGQFLTGILMRAFCKTVLQSAVIISRYMIAVSVNNVAGGDLICMCSFSNKYSNPPSYTDADLTVTSLIGYIDRL